MKPTTEIAEELAEKLVVAWSLTDEFPISLNQVTLQTIPLLELLEVARAVSIWNEETVTNTDRNQKHIHKILEALTKLREKLPDL